MEKLFGFMLFFIGIGMIIGMLIAENVVLVVSAGVFLLLGYHLFCHESYRRLRISRLTYEIKKDCQLRQNIR